MGAPALRALPAPAGRPAARRRERSEPPRLLALAGGEARTAAAATAESVLTLAWAALASGHPAACPLCGGTMAPRPAAAATAGGRCRGCGTSLE